MTPADLTPLLSAGLAGLAGALFGAAAYGYLAPTSRMFLPMVSRGDASSGAVALTFDDGPHPTGTAAILDILAEKQVPAAFFVIGAHVRAYPHLVRRMDAEGHLVCNHSHDHVRLSALRGPRYWLDQIRRTDAAIEEVIGKTPAFFRPPWGHKSPSMHSPLRALGKTPIGWTRRAFDGIQVAPEAIVRRIAPKARPGDVILLHDGRGQRSNLDPSPTVDALPELIDRMRQRGLTFARLDDLLGREPYSAARSGAPATTGALSG